MMQNTKNKSEQHFVHINLIYPFPFDRKNILFTWIAERSHKSFFKNLGKQWLVVCFHFLFFMVGPRKLLPFNIFVLVKHIHLIQLWKRKSFYLFIIYKRYWRNHSTISPLARKKKSSLDTGHIGGGGIQIYLATWATSPEPQENQI